MASEERHKKKTKKIKNGKDSVWLGRTSSDKRSAFCYLISKH